MYWNPALSEFNAIGAKYPLTQALFYDASVREGADGMQSLVSQAGSTTDEATFDQNFINVYTSALKKENLGDTDRMVGFQQVLDSGNVNLVTPYKFTAYGDTFTINGDLGITSSSSTVTNSNNNSNSNSNNNSNSNSNINSNSNSNSSSNSSSNSNADSKNRHQNVTSDNSISTHKSTDKSTSQNKNIGQGDRGNENISNSVTNLNVSSKNRNRNVSSTNKSASEHKRTDKSKL
jgi:chitosanase